MPSFNVQNAKSLEITEGDVATIHDADGRQLWGKLNYTTKYEGDTEQTSYTGKNLMTMVTAAMTDDTDRQRNFYINLPADDYVISFDLDSYDLGTNTSFGIYMQLYDSSQTVIVDKTLITIDSSTTTGRKSITFNLTRPATADRYANIRIAATNWNNGARAILSHIQIEAGSTPTAYEPYVGGIPAPNPDYPQPINVVTGTQTVTIAGGTVSQDYTVHLGTLELAKIGSVQDYIYKNNGNWYKHVTIGKVTYVGTEEGWNQNSTTTGARYYIIQNDIGLPAYNGEGDDMMCYYFSGIRYASYYSVGGVDGVTHSYSGNNAYMQIFFRTSFNGVNNFKTWLTTHNTTVYYALATPSDTQITDTSLIAELDAIEEWVTRCGYTATISGNLPIVINQTEIV